MLETLERALARGATIHGEVAGYGRNADAHHITAPSPGGAGAAACMQLALDDAGLDAAAHRARQRARHVDPAQRRRRGRGDPQGVRRRRAAGHLDQGRDRPHDRRRRARPRPCIALLSLRDGVVPPTANLEQIGDDIGLDVVSGRAAADRAQAGALELVRVRRAQRHAHPRPGRRHRVTAAARPSSGTAAPRSSPSLRELDGRTVSWFRLDGGKHRGAIGTAEGEAIERAVHLAVELGIPVVGRIASSGADVSEGVAALHAWGRVAKALADASGVVPIVLVARRARRCRAPRCCSGIADHVIMTSDAFAYVSGPEVVVAFTGVADRPARRSAARRSTSARAASRRSSSPTRTTRCSRSRRCSRTCPSNHLADPPVRRDRRPVDRAVRRAPRRRCPRARPRRTTCAPSSTTCSTSTRSSSCAPTYAPNMVTGLGRLDGRPVGIVANQPLLRAGTLDIEASREGGALRAVVRRVQLPDRHLRRHARLRAGPRPRVARHDPPRRRAGARVRGGHRAAALRRAAQGLRRRVHRDGLEEPRQRLVRRVADGRDRGDGRARRGADPPPAATSRRSTTTPSGSPSRLALEAEYAERFANPYVAAERGLRRRRHRRRPTPAASSPTRCCGSAPSASSRPTRRHSQHAALATSRTGGHRAAHGKRILVTGVLNDASIAFSVARLAQEQGAEVVLSSFGRVMRLTERTAKRLPDARRADRRARRHQRGRPRRARRQRRRPARRRACTRSRSRPSRASAAGSSTRRGTTSRSRCRCRRTR